MKSFFSQSRKYFNLAFISWVVSDSFNAKLCDKIIVSLSFRPSR